MSQPLANYCSNVLSNLKGHKELKEDTTEAALENRKKTISNPAINFSDFVNAADTTNGKSHQDHKLSQ
jgi:hypothetical protein